MLLLFILIIAISLPYFSFNRIYDVVFWIRVFIISFLIYLLLSLLITENNSIITLYNGLFTHTLQSFMFIETILLIIIAIFILFRVAGLHHNNLSSLKDSYGNISSRRSFSSSARISSENKDILGKPFIVY